jgi:hypothetical protein
MANQNIVIVTLSKDRKILDTTGFISDEQFQKVLVEVKKKDCSAKMMGAVDAKYHRDYNLPVEY